MLTQPLADDLIRRANVAMMHALAATTDAQKRAAREEAARWMRRLKEAANATS